MKELFRTLWRVLQLTCVMIVLLATSVALVMVEAVSMNLLGVLGYVLLPALTVSALLDQLLVVRGMD